MSKIRSFFTYVKYQLCMILVVCMIAVTVGCTDSGATGTGAGSNDKNPSTGAVVTQNDSTSADKSDGKTESASQNETQKETMAPLETSDSIENEGDSTSSQVPTEGTVVVEKESVTVKPTETQKPTTKPAETQSATTKPAETTPIQTQAPATQPATTHASNATTVDSIVAAVIKPGMSEFDKALALHNWLTFNIDYDYTFTHYYIEETLRDKIGVCQGYALCYEAMCKKAGIEVKYVTGSANNGSGSQPHAWNQVKIGGKWYNVDVTWDDPSNGADKDPKDHKFNNYDYFLVSDGTLNKDHTAEIATNACSSDYDRKTILKAAIATGLHGDIIFADSSNAASLIKNAYYTQGKTSIKVWYYDTSIADNDGNAFNTKLSAILKSADIAGKKGYSYSYTYPSRGLTSFTLTVK